MTRRSVGASVILIWENIKLTSLLTSSSKLLRASFYSLLRPTVGRIDDPREVGQATYSRFFRRPTVGRFLPLPSALLQRRSEALFSPSAILRQRKGWRREVI